MRTCKQCGIEQTLDNFREAPSAVRKDGTQWVYRRRVCLTCEGERWEAWRADRASRKTHLELFAGIGGMSIAAEVAGFETTGVVEIDKRLRIELARNFPGAYIWGDINGISARTIHDRIGRPTVISAGFPCQPFSIAGKREGISDSRNLFPAVVRLLREFIELGEPVQWLVGENVRGLLSMRTRSGFPRRVRRRLGIPRIGTVFGDILRDLAGLGYRVGWSCYGADESAGAPHFRDRVFIVAYYVADGNGNNGDTNGSGSRQGRNNGGRESSGRGRSMGNAGNGIGREPSERYSRTIAELADASRRGAKLKDEPAGERLALRGGGEMADADGARRRERRRAEPNRAQDAAIERDRAVVADSPVEGRSGRASVPARAGERRRELESQRRRERLESGRAHVPGRTDYDAWRTLLESEPKLAPGLTRTEEAELGLRGSLNGLSRRLALRALGNAVDPWQVFPIFEEIARAEGLEVSEL